MTALTPGTIIVVQYRGRDKIVAGEPTDNRWVRVEAVEQTEGDLVTVTRYLENLDPRLESFVKIEPLCHLEGKQRRYREHYVGHYVYQEADADQVFEIIKQLRRKHPAIFPTEKQAQALVLPRSKV
jgi:hypothetical protein